MSSCYGLTTFESTTQIFNHKTSKAAATTIQDEIFCLLAD